MTESGKPFKNAVCIYFAKTEDREIAAGIIAQHFPKEQVRNIDGKAVGIMVFLPDDSKTCFSEIKAVLHQNEVPCVFNNEITIHLESDELLLRAFGLIRSRHTQSGVGHRGYGTISVSPAVIPTLEEAKIPFTLQPEVMNTSFAREIKAMRERYNGKNAGGPPRF